jgi:N6-adenosine-specific RNA methylase IME4
VNTPWDRVSVEELRELPVGKLAASDAVLLVHTDNRHLPEALSLLGGFGFAYETLLTVAWDEPRGGGLLDEQTEHWLVGVRGRPTYKPMKTSTLITRADEVYRLLEHRIEGQKVELFARGQREGWCCFADGAGTEW